MLFNVLGLKLHGKFNWIMVLICKASIAHQTNLVVQALFKLNMVC
jgi:hypothetical protein